MSLEREVIHKEIDLIQSCINRVANNSFLLKGWAVSLVAVVLALAKDLDHRTLEMILLLPVICFWYLDAFFLRTERLYRKIYEWVIKNRSHTEDYLYDLNPQRFEGEVNSTFCVMFSATLFIFYGIPFLFLIAKVFFPFLKCTG